MTTSIYTVDSTTGCRLAGNEDITQVARIHLIAFPNFFLTSLGFNFLYTMYRVFLCNPANIFMVFEKDGAIHGFAVGLMGTAGSDLKVAIRFLPELCFALIPVFFFHPLVISKRIINRIVSTSSSLNISDSEVMLRSIAVLPESRGHGIAEILIKNFEVQAVTAGAVRAVLTTDANENERALAFYFKNGFEITHKFYRYNKRAMYLMKKNLS
jgi:ribosomal protein S18 acetylase RimI-like enzyme